MIIIRGVHARDTPQRRSLTSEITTVHTEQKLLITFAKIDTTSTSSVPSFSWLARTASSRNSVARAGACHPLILLTRSNWAGTVHHRRLRHIALHRSIFVAIRVYLVRLQQCRTQSVVFVFCMIMYLKFSLLKCTSLKLNCSRHHSIAIGVVLEILVNADALDHALERLATLV